MKKLAFITSFLLIGLGFSCSSQQEIFRVQGEFTNLNDAELYFWTPEGGHGKIDTVTVREGKFAYESPQTTPGWYIMLFQNMSEQVLFAEPGIEVSVEADATHLRDMKVRGGKANELMTEFRMQVAQQTQLRAIQTQTRAFILQHPESIVSVYLFHKYYIQHDANEEDIKSLLETLLKAQPENNLLGEVKTKIQNRSRMRVGMKAADFHVRDRQGNERELASYKDSTLLLCFWANWNQDSKEDLRGNLRKRAKEWGKNVSILTISLDLQKVSWRTFLRMDTVPGRHVCDLNAWDSPIVKAYGITELPTYILIKDQKIVARETELERITP